MGKKRLTYAGADGKRHWVAIHRYSVPEGVVFVPAENPCESHTHNPLPLATTAPKVIVRGIARDQPEADDHKLGTSQQNTMPLE